MAIEKFYKKPGDKRAVEAEIISKKRIGSGIYGIAYQAEVKVGDLPEPFLFVVKEYPVPKEAQHAIDVFTSAKATGLKVFNTYRISESGDKIIMTTALSKGNVCFTSNNDEKVSKEFATKKLESIIDFDGFLKRYFNQALIAAKNNISIPGDAPFFIFEKGSKEINLDFVLGDLDALVVYPYNLDPITQARAYKQNVEKMGLMLGVFINSLISDPAPYLKLIDHYVREITVSVAAL